MTRAFDFTLVGVITTISIVIHRVGLTLFAPGQPLYDVAADATTLGGSARAFLWFQIIVIWAPLLTIACIWLWAMIREFRRQVTTSATPVRR
jgi:hypothetical protein